MKIFIIILLLAFLIQSGFVISLLLRIRRMKTDTAEEPSNNTDDQDHISNVDREEEEHKESILNGIENNEFKMYLQFVVDTKTKKLVSAEALSRWDNPQKGLLGPGHYIVYMENSGLISKHDFYMFEHAC